MDVGDVRDKPTPHQTHSERRANSASAQMREPGPRPSAEDGDDIATKRRSVRAPQPPPALSTQLQTATELSRKANSLDELKAILEKFERHPLHATAQNTVFARGDVNADLMIVGEAPGRDEDREGKPFVGRSGKLLDAMFAAIGLSAERGVYITNVVNWRPPGNRSPSAEEIQLCLPFIHRHIALKNPKILVLTGSVAAQSLGNVTTGITRLRGRWIEYKIGNGKSLPAMPIYHPAFLLRRPEEKRDAWRDLVAIESKLNGLT